MNLTLDFPFDEAVLKKNPEALIRLVKQLYIKVQKLEKENNQVRLLEKEVARLQAELAKYTSPHIPSSKQLYPKKKNINKMIKSGLPKKVKGKRGGSKIGRSGVTWDQKEPDEVIHNYVEECLNCHKIADKNTQK
ncbi:MAG: hypothetical protein ACC656_14410, partial [Candidatus Heimdallarchaeota archaeon]